MWRHVQSLVRLFPSGPRHFGNVLHNLFREDGVHQFPVGHFVSWLFGFTHMKKSPDDESKLKLVDIIQRFSTDDECRARLTHLRWPGGVTCPRCHSAKVSEREKRNQYECKGCLYQFSATSGTIFHDSHMPLSKWFLAIYMMTESKKGISACQIERTIGVSYKTAWFLCHRIRAAMRDANCELLRGIVEVDETYVGGKTRGTGHDELEHRFNNRKNEYMFRDTLLKLVTSSKMTFQQLTKAV